MTERKLSSPGAKLFAAWLMSLASRTVFWAWKSRILRSYEKKSHECYGTCLSPTATCGPLSLGDTSGCSQAPHRNLFKHCTAWPSYNPPFPAVPRAFLRDPHAVDGGSQVNCGPAAWGVYTRLRDLGIDQKRMPLRGGADLPGCGWGTKFYCLRESCPPRSRGDLYAAPRPGSQYH